MKYKLVGAYKLSSTYPCFLRPIFEYDGKLFFQTNRLGHYVYTKLSNDTINDKTNIVQLPVNIDNVTEMLHCFAFNENDIIIGNLDDFTTELTKRKNEVTDETLKIKIEKFITKQSKRIKNNSLHIT